MSSNDVISSAADGVRIIKLNRPKILNALNDDMYLEITNILNKDADNNMIVVTIMTGCGRYFSSGRYIGDTDIKDQDHSAAKNLVSALINYPKLLIAVVNGPAYGIAVTMLGLFDVVYASDRATFDTPFLRLGMTPEGCSSYTFSKILRRSKATEMLLLGKKLTAEEALRLGFVSKIVPHEQLSRFIDNLKKYGQLPVNTIINAKKLINAPIIRTLHKTASREWSQLDIIERSPKALKLLASTLSKRNKL